MHHQTPCCSKVTWPGGDVWLPQGLTLARMVTDIQKFTVTSDSSFKSCPVQNWRAVSIWTRLRHAVSSARGSPNAHAAQSELITKVREALESCAVLSTQPEARETSGVKGSWSWKLWQVTVTFPWMGARVRYLSGQRHHAACRLTAACPTTALVQLSRLHKLVCMRTHSEAMQNELKQAKDLPILPNYSNKLGDWDWASTNHTWKTRNKV